MKKQSILACFALIILFSATVQAQVKPNVIISSFQVKQGRAEVGKDFTLALLMVNTEPSACAASITVSLQAGFPFIMNGLSTILVGDLCDSSPKEVDFPMKIDPSATGGFYQITVTANYETTSFVALSNSQTVNFLVNGSPNINSYITNSIPVKVYPGDSAKITVTVENDGSFDAQSVNAMLTSDNEIEVSPLNSLGAIGLLPAKQSKNVDFTVDVPKNAKGTSYPLNLKISYLDEQLNEKMKFSTINFQVQKKAMFNTTETGSQSLHPNDNSRTVKLLITNKGTDSAHRIQAKLIPQFPLSTDGSTRYIDQLNPGESSSAEFIVNVDKDGTAGTYGLDMLLDYEDNQGKSMQDTATVSITVQPKGLIRTVFINFWYLWAIAIILAGIVFLRKSRQQKKKK
ncbi:MAG: COG1361 S-layer family protein [Candidatus Woesearchaeota archaeon]